jgi:hypothetical protein
MLCRMLRSLSLHQHRATCRPRTPCPAQARATPQVCPTAPVAATPRASRHAAHTRLYRRALPAGCRRHRRRPRRAGPRGRLRRRRPSSRSCRRQRSRVLGVLVPGMSGWHACVRRWCVPVCGRCVLSQSVSVAELATQLAAGVDAYIVPSEDPHQSEYAAACFERRQYISRFTVRGHGPILPSVWPFTDHTPPSPAPRARLARLSSPPARRCCGLTGATSCKRRRSWAASGA